MGYDQSLANILVLLHACQSQWTFTIVCHYAWIGSEHKKDANDLQVIVDWGLHETSQTEVIHYIDIKDALLILAFLYSPVI